MKTCDWYKVIGNDSHVMAINTESLKALRSSIDQSQSVGLPSGELEFRDSSAIRAWSGIPRGHGGTIEVHLSVYEVVVGCWSWVPARLQWLHNFLHNLKVLRMIPVCEEDWAEINIVVRIFRAMNDERPK
jgi:hypothetical protein